MAIPVSFFDAVPTGAAPLLSALCDEIDLVRIINERVRFDAVQCTLSPGLRIKALVINTLCGREPLYRVQEYYADQDISVLLGSEVSAAELNDDALGRGLEYLAQSKPGSIYNALALRAAAVHHIDLSCIHFDTTSISVEGAYEESQGLLVTYGYSKDHRDDLKQFMFGLCTAERIPMVGDVGDGNCSDMTWNGDIISDLRGKLGDALPKKAIYVADAASVTHDNLKAIDEQKLDFVSRLPARYRLHDELIEQAWQSDHPWIDVGALSEGTGRAQYRLKDIEAELDERRYRFVVVHSSVLDERKKKTWERNLQKERQTQEDRLAELSKHAFHCQADAQAAIEDMRKRYKGYWQCTYDIQASTEIVKRSQRGRPRKGETPEMQTVYRVQCYVSGWNEAKVERAIAKLGTFVLITTLPCPEQAAVEVLKIYKGQEAVETRFRFLKNPQQIGPIFLKNTDRIEALAYVFLMALLIYSLLERRVRQNLETKEEAPLVLPGGRKSKMPTGQMLLVLLSRIQVMIYEEEGRRVHRALSRLSADAERIIRLAGFDLEIYVTEKVGKGRK